MFLEEAYAMAAKKEKKEAAAATCVYCGGNLPEKPLRVRVKETTFHVCSIECQSAAERYLALDKRFKLPLYIVIFAAAVVILITAISDGTMFYSHIMQIVVGAAFFIWPYPVSVFTTFQNSPIRFIVRVTRVVGSFLAVFGIILLLR